MTNICRRLSLPLLVLSAGALPAGCAGRASTYCDSRSETGCAADAPPTQSQVTESMPPIGYIVKWSRCAHFIEGVAQIRANSRVVKVAADGTVPIQRVEPVADAKENFRRVVVSKVPNRLLGGEGVLRGAPAVGGANPGSLTRTLGASGGGDPEQKVSFVKLGQVVLSTEADGSVVQWVVSSEQLGEPVYNEGNGRLEYQDTCYRNPNAVGHDTSGWVEPGTELAISCVVEEMNTEYNAYSAYGWTPLVNYVTTWVPTANDPSTRPHPDAATYEGYQLGAFQYSGYGAALNDINGTERDPTTAYLPGEQYCHNIVNSGYEVPGSKRPATKSLPAPGVVNAKTLIEWRPVNPNVIIANDQEPAAPDPVEPEPEPAQIPVDPDALAPL
jgi:hypothetical protein